jgi:hypothetical protein
MTKLEGNQLIGCMFCRDGRKAKEAKPIIR